MDRRLFLTGIAGILAAGVAPAIITTPGLLMPIRNIWTPTYDNGTVWFGPAYVSSKGANAIRTGSEINPFASLQEALRVIGDRPVTIEFASDHEETLLTDVIIHRGQILNLNYRVP